MIAVFVLGIAGMIGFSIADNNGGALTAGLVTAVAALCLMVATAVGSPATARASAPDTEHAAADVEARVQAMVDRGADEAELRALVQAAVDLGRARR